MAVRCLVYYAELIKKLYGTDENFKNNIYKSTVMKIPAPEFIVLYIGKEKLNQEKELLSQHFEVQTGALEAVVQYQDIHYETLEKEKLKQGSLLGFSFLIHQVTFYIRQGKAAKEAFQLALADCKKESYLLEYIERREFLVMGNLSISIEELMEIRAEDAREQGIKQGIEQGKAEGKVEGRAEGKAEILRTMKNTGLGIEDIAKLTGLTIEQINQILQ